MVIKTWNGGSGTWSTPTAWTPNGVPADGDDVFLAGAGGTITLDINTANLNSVAFNSTNNLVFAIGTFTLTVTGTSSSAITTGTTGTQEITIAGGTINDSGGLVIDPGSSLSGFGTLNIAGSITGLGTLRASGGLLDVFGTIASGVVLSIDSTAGSDLRIEGSAISAAAITLNNAAQHLEIGAAGSLTISAAQSITNGTILLSGGNFTDASGLTIGNGALLTGFGRVAANITATSGTIAASGGTLRLTGTVTGGTPLTIAANAILSLEDTPTGGTVTFNSGSSGVLRLTGTTVDSNHRLSGFDDTIAGLNVGGSTTPTNYIDLSGIASSAIDSVTLSGSTIEVTEVAGPVFDLTLAGPPSGFVNWTSDGASGTNIFLAANPAYTSRNDIDSWLDPSSWGGSVPPTVPVAGAVANFTFYNHSGNGNGNNSDTGDDVILLPTSLGQATGAGNSVWTISDSRNTTSIPTH